jgi:hypothetical protein
VHGNVTRVLRALDSPVTSTGHGRGVVHGGSRRFLLLGIGIGSPCRGRPGSEMTGTGVVGCVLAKRGCSRWPWRRLGGRGVLEQCHCKVEPGLGFVQGGVGLLGVDGGGWLRSEREREGFSRGGRLHRAPPLPRCQLNRTRGKDFPQILWSQRGDLELIFFPLLVGLQEKKKERETNKS